MLLLVNPSATWKRVYQDLSKEITAIEPPFWAALTAGFIRKQGYPVNILDANAFLKHLGRCLLIPTLLPEWGCQSK